MGWDVILPIDELIFFNIVKTTNQYFIYCVLNWAPPKKKTKTGRWFGTFLFFHILGMSSSQLTFMFFRWVGIPPTSKILLLAAATHQKSRRIRCQTEVPPVSVVETHGCFKMSSGARYLSITLWLWLTVRHGFSMALIEIDGLPSYNSWWIFPWQTVSHNQMVYYISIYLGKFHHDRTLFSRTLESWFILGKSSPCEAQQFRLVKYDNLPRYMSIPCLCFFQFMFIVVKVYPLFFEECISSSALDRGLYRCKFLFRHIPNLAWLCFHRIACRTVDFSNDKSFILLMLSELLLLQYLLSVICTNICIIIYNMYIYIYI